MMENHLDKRIRILFPMDNMRDTENPYVCSIVENIEESDGGAFVFLDGALSFWERDDYAAVHFMWPVSVMVSGHDCAAIAKRIDYLKNVGIKIMATCHNLVPHYDQNREHIRCYELVYEKCDEIYHLGAYSFNLFEEKYPGKNKILYHQVYTKRYTFFPDKGESRNFLHLNPIKKYILCFGAVRSKEERDLIRYCAHILKGKASFVVPSYLPFCLVSSPNFVKRLIKRALALLFIMRERLFYPNILFSLKNKVLEDDIPYWFSACDIGFIHRCRILNSGNLPLNYYYGNVVVGPDVGNVGVILKETGNPVFSVSDYDTAVTGIIKGLHMQADGVGKQNRDFAVQNWSEDKIAAQQAAYYKALLLDAGKTSTDEDVMKKIADNACLYRRGGY